MLITIKYFGQIAEVTSKSEEQINFDGETISGLTEHLYNKYTGLKKKDFQIAQHQELVDFETKLTGEDIALLPPFSGG